MERDGVKSILFVYDERKTKHYLCLSAFFSLSGILTAGRKWKGEDIEENLDNECDLVLFLGEWKSDTVSDKCVFLSVDMEDTDEDLIDKVLSKLGSESKFTTGELDVFNEIKRIYCEYDLSRVEYTGQFYFYVKDKMTQVFEKYYHACAELRQVQKKEEYLENPYLWYVRGQLVRRMQNISSVTNTDKIYDIRLVIERLQDIVSKNTDFISYYVLMGHLAETDDDWKEKAGSYYTKCTDVFREYKKNCPCMSAVYYSLGHWWEAQSDRNSANKYYNLSYACDKYNYRALFKIARYEEQVQKNYESAWGLYTQIQDQLEGIKSRNYLQPIDNEYLCKVYYIKWEMVKEGKVNGENMGFKEKLFLLSEQDLGHAQFFKDFYGAEAERYFNYMLERTKNFQKKLQ